MIRSRAEPDLLGPLRADSSADWMIASRCTAAADTGVGETAFSSISLVSSSSSSEPQLTPMRTGLPYLSASSISVENCVSRFALKPTLPGLIRYLASASAARRMIGQQLVADIVEIADQRHVDAARRELVADMRHRRRALVAIDRDAHQLRAGAPELADLLHRRLDVGGVGVGHRLHDDRRAAADHDAADIDADRVLARGNAHLRDR